VFSPRVAAILDRLDAIDRVAIVLEIGRAMRAGRLEALRMTDEEADAERRLWSHVALRSYAHRTYPAESERQKAANVASDLLRHPHIRRALGVEVLSCHRVRQILRGG